MVNCPEISSRPDSFESVAMSILPGFGRYTSNIFAIIGLRAMYFVLVAVIHRFRYMNYALALVLVMIGLKAFYAHSFDKIPSWIALSVTLGILVLGFLSSFLKTKLEAAQEKN